MQPHINRFSTSHATQTPTLHASITSFIISSFFALILAQQMDSIIDLLFIYHSFLLALFTIFLQNFSSLSFPKLHFNTFSTGLYLHHFSCESSLAIFFFTPFNLSRSFLHTPISYHYHFSIALLKSSYDQNPCLLLMILIYHDSYHLLVHGIRPLSSLYEFEVCFRVFSCSGVFWRTLEILELFEVYYCTNVSGG